MGVITAKNQRLIEECVNMMEGYYDTMSDKKSETFLAKLSDSDQALWITTYHPALVATDIIMDDRFFAAYGNMKNYGLGIDSIMNVAEFCNLMSQLYKALVSTLKMEVSPNKDVCDCLRMLEPYLQYYANSKDVSAHTTLQAEHMHRWVNGYYKSLVESGLIPDNVFFDATGENKNIGIGKNGIFNGTELLHFIYECYKYLYVNGH